MGSRPIALDIGRVCSIWVSPKDEPIQARRVQCPVILDGYPFNKELYTPLMIVNSLFIKLITQAVQYHRILDSSSYSKYYSGSTSVQ